MSDALLLLPDLLLILAGFVICRYTPLGRPVWDAAEKLVYYLLFPVLLFQSILRSPLHPAETSTLAGSCIALLLCGIGMAYALRRLPGVDPQLHASGAQTAFRFNSFIALALGERLAGTQGLAWVALLVALCVPLCNVAAVWPLARQGGHSYLGELVRNPLIVATVAGLIANVAAGITGYALPEVATTTLQRIGSAALPLGLMSVGAGLKLGGLAAAPGLAAGFLVIRHALLPALALALGVLAGLPPLQRLILVAFMALPTASSAYVLAARMGGNASFVAGLVTLSTLLGMLGVPVWLAIARQVIG